MKYNRISTTTAVALTLLLSFFMPACSDGESGGPDIPEVKNAQLTIHLASSQNARPVTKADNNMTEESDEAYERQIETCWVVIFNEEGTWMATASTTNFTINHIDEDSRSTATVELPVGTYTGYAFANLGNLTEGNTLISALESGKKDGAALTEKNLEDWAVSLIGTENFKSADGKAIPMSSYAQSIVVSETGKNEADIPLFRMLGKVTISVSNQTGNILTFKQLSMEKFRNGAIKLLPYSEGNITLNDLVGKPVYEESLLPSFPTDATFSTYTHRVEIASEGTSIANSDETTFSFYPFETGTESNPSAALNVTLQINDRPASTKSTGFSFMRRNDWLEIPIVISNITSVIRFKNMRMPIGGLPYEIVYGETDGIQFLVDAVNVVDPDYAGPLEIEVEVKSIAQISSGLAILASNAAGEGTLRSSAVLTDNTVGLLIDKKTGTSLATNTEFAVTIPDNANPTTAGFQVWTQELSKQSTATIRLNLVAEYGNSNPKQRIEIPYTIRIQNYKETTRTTQEGGNS